MTVKPCSNIVDNCVDILPFISQSVTPEEFDKGWIAMVGEDKPLSLGNDWSEHAMCLAAKVNNVQLIRHVFQRDPTVLDLGDDVGWTPLFYAVRYKHIEALDTLLELGANPNIASIEVLEINEKPADTIIPEGATSLWLTAQFTNDVATAKLLLKYGAVVAPKIDEKGQGILDKAQKELTADRASLISTIDGAVQGIAHPLLLMIVDYV